MYFIYPTLFMIIPLLLFYANNPVEMMFGRIRMLLAVMMVAVIGFMLFMHYVCGLDYNIAAPITCGAIALFYTPNVNLKRFARLASRYAHQHILKYLAVAAFCYFVVAYPKFFTIALDIIAVIITSSILIIRATAPKKAPIAENDQTKAKVNAESADKPDIYVIILDGYQGYLSSKAEGYDNPFFQQLRDRGLFVADVALSNYQRTAGSIPFIMDMDYSSKERIYKEPWWDHLVTGKVPSFLRSIGYNHVIISGSFTASLKETFPKENIKFKILKYNNYHLESFFDRTIISLHSNNKINLRVKYIHASFRECTKLIENDSPKFIFQHIVTPHTPFVFKANGTTHRKYIDYQDVGFDNAWQKYYFGQVEHISNLFLNTLDQVIDEIKKKNNKAVLLIHGDHGWGMNSTSLFSADTLFAAYGHGIDVHSIFPKQLSLVNMYRHLFNNLFNSNYNYLEYKFFTYKSEDITKDVKAKLAELLKTQT